MKTYSELKQFIEKTGCRFECNPIIHEYEYFHPYNGIVKDEIIEGYSFGIKNPSQKKGKSEWQWVWFESIGEKLNEDTRFFFRHRYSQVNAKTYKGWEERARINERIEKVIA